MLEAHEDLVELGLLTVSGRTGSGSTTCPTASTRVPGTRRGSAYDWATSVVDAHRSTGLDEMLTGDLNAFMALGPDAWREARAALTRVRGATPSRSRWTR